MFSARDPSDIDRFFRGLTEYAFHARLGVVDPLLVDYVALLLVRHLRLDRVAAVPGVGGEEPPEVTKMLVVAQRHASADEAREEYRRIGDCTLFWSGVYPEAVRRFERPGRPENLIGYREAGRRAYWLAASLVAGRSSPASRSPRKPGSRTRRSAPACPPGRIASGISCWCRVGIRSRASSGCDTRSGATSGSRSVRASPRPSASRPGSTSTRCPTCSTRFRRPEALPGPRSRSAHSNGFSTSGPLPVSTGKPSRFHAFMPPLST